jgi:hypothetical protein
MEKIITYQVKEGLVLSIRSEKNGIVSLVLSQDECIDLAIKLLSIFIPKIIQTPEFKRGLKQFLECLPVLLSTKEFWQGVKELADFSIPAIKTYLRSLDDL